MTFYVDNYIRDLLKNLKKEIKTYRTKIKKAIRTVEKEIEDVTYKLKRKVSITVAKFKTAARRELEAIAPMIDDAFTVDSPTKAAQMAEIYGEDLSSALYETQLRLEGLRNSIIRAASPIAQAVVPIVNTAIKALTALTNTVGKIIASFFESTLGVKAYENSLKSAVQTTASAQRYLAGFDEIQRLGNSDSSGLTAALIPDTEQILPGWETLASKIGELFAPLKDINFAPAIEATRKALKALEPVLSAVGEAAAWAVSNILVPVMEWAAENVLPAVIDVLTTALETLGQVIEDIRPTLTWLWENALKYIAQWYGDKIIADIQAMGDGFKEMGDKVQQYIPTIETVTQKIDEILGLGEDLRTDAGLWDRILTTVLPLFDRIAVTSSLLPGPMGAVLTLLEAFLPTLEGVTGGFDGMKENALGALEAVKGMLGGLWEFTQEEVVAPAEKGTRTFLNNIIGFFEGSIKGISGAYNKMFASLGTNLENIETVAPSIGSAARSVRFTSIQMPAIPRLAQGAVLPANKPFMAVVGDQRHGTNVEAPLETIQQALDLALADRLEGMMAGFNAVTSRQEQILDAIYGLDVSDGAIAGAVARYERRMALATGGI